MLAKRQKVRLTSAERDILEKFVAHGNTHALLTLARAQGR